jgi:2-desacetyl-2-hydroxyethyl bacteriochlorophyllide A dehydrogenase
VPTRARAFWVAAPGQGEIRSVDVPEPGLDDVLVRTAWSGISRGTESLVFRGGVPEGQRETMRAPHQEGDFPGPVKYGYLNVGVVAAGPAELLGRSVFCLYPHQTRYVVPAASVLVVPDGVPARRAVLAGTVETAVNAIWDSAPLPGDRVAVVGAGMVGAGIARLLAGIVGVQVTLVDTNSARHRLADHMGVGFAHPTEAPRDLDLALHTSGTGAGLQCALDLLAADGTVVDLSWYGDQPVTLSLGGAFHDRRLAIRASQVGAVAQSRRARRTTRDRLALALELLRDPAFDALLTGSSAFADLPETMARVVDSDELCHTISYEGE